MTVPVQTPYTASTANGVTTVFPYGFLILSDDDLVVTVDGIVITTGYTVSGVGVVSGGDVTFSIAPANGAKVVRYLAPIFERTTDYPQFGDWLAETVNADFDRQWLALQYLKQNDVRSIKLPVDTSTDQVVTATADERANKSIKFDASGNVILTTGDPDDSAEYATAAAASASAAALSEAAAETAQGLAEDARDLAQGYAASIDPDTLVKLTGDQTIADIKTFTSSPIVPTPTSSSQAANYGFIAGRINFATCSTASATAAKEVTISGYTPIAGDTLYLTFTNKNTADTPTFIINGVAYAIKTQDGRTPSSTIFAYFPAYTIRFIFDGTAFRFIYEIVFDDVSGASYVKKYSNGWLEQGGVTSGLYSYQSFSILSAMFDTIWKFNATPSAIPNTGSTFSVYGTGDGAGSPAKTTTSLPIVTAYQNAAAAGVAAITFDWKVEGRGA